MTDFRQVTQSVLASPQITLADVAAAAERGVALVINNRPEGEAEDQTPGPVIESAARAAGMDYVAIPVSHAGFSQNQVAAMSAALASAKGPVLAYCRSGTRSTLLWALSQASQGQHPDDIAAAAAGAGYDVTPIRPLMDALVSGG